MSHYSESLDNLENIMTVDSLKCHFSSPRGLSLKKSPPIKAVDGVSFEVKRGQTLGLVGESGSGKSTLGFCLISRYKPTSGDARFEGNSLKSASAQSMRRLRKNLQLITQDPFASLDPRFTVKDCVAEGMRIHGVFGGKKEISERVLEMLDLVGLRPEHASRYPHEFSGGQRQRISIARALALQPSFLVCDEVVSALDVSIQGQIIALLEKLQDELGLTYVFIAHDLAVVRHLSHTVAVMYLGKIMEMAGSDELYHNPLHPYTRALLSASPLPDPKLDRKRERIVLRGEIPSPSNPPQGCRFCGRCPEAKGICFEKEPEFRKMGMHPHFAACHLT